MLQDLRYALRMLAKTPGFSAIAVLALALGIGANTAIFTVVNAVLLRPLPYPDSDRLVFLNEESKNLRGMSVSYLNLLDWQKQNTVFETIGATQPTGLTLTGGDHPELLQARAVNHEFFPMMGIPAAQGRVFSAGDDQRSAARTAILSYGFWQRRFGGRVMLGQTLSMSGQSYTVVGIMPRNFLYRSGQDEVFIPLGLAADQMQQRGNHPGIYAIARMKPGVTVEQARSEMKTIAARLAQQYPDSNAGNSVEVQSYVKAVIGDVRDALVTLFAAVGFVLLIACANVANLLLARANSRQKEVAVRMALGASRFRLVRQLLTESVLLSLIGGGIGLMIAAWGIDLLVKAAPDALPRILEIKIDQPVLWFTLGAAVLTGMLFGLVPALQASSPHLHDTLKEGGRTAGTGGRHRLRSLLVVSEVALSLVLLAGAGLLMRSFARLRAIDPGLNTDHVLTARLILPGERYPGLRFGPNGFEGDDSNIRSFFDELYARGNARPGVKWAGTIPPLPLSGEGWQTDYRVQSAPRPAAGQYPNTDIHYVSPRYLETMQIPLRKGRNFTDADRDRHNPVVMVNETFARKWWPDREPIGQLIRLNAGTDPRSENDQINPWATVVGVVGDVRQYGLDTQAKTEVYIPQLQLPRSYTFLVVRTEGDPLAMTNTIRSAVQGIDRDLPLATVQTMDSVLESTVASRKLSTGLLTGFAALALLLAAVGIYGVISYSVTQRTHEIGIRMALGAAQRDVLRMIVGQAFRLMAIGVVTGIVLAAAVSRLIRSLLFQTGPADPLTFAAIVVILTVVAFAASLIPARRATKVDPMIALRYE